MLATDERFGSWCLSEGKSERPAIADHHSQQHLTIGTEPTVDFLTREVARRGTVTFVACRFSDKWEDERRKVT